MRHDAAVYAHLTALALACATAWLGPSCDSKNESAADTGTAHTRPTDETDPRGVELPHGLDVVASDELPEDPSRIVSLAPSVTETLFAIGSGDRVVAVTRFCDHPSRVEGLPRIGGLTDTDLESILAVKPDLVVGVDAERSKALRRKLAETKTPYAFLPVETLEQALVSIRAIGALSGRAESADALVEKMEHRMKPVDVPSERPGVLVVFGHDPLVAAGPGTFAHEFVRRAGGRNVLADADRPYPILDVEKVVEIDPERIIDTHVDPESAEDFWSRFRSLQAVERGHVYEMEDPGWMRPGPRLPKGFDFFRRAVAGESPSPRRGGTRR